MVLYIAPPEQYFIAPREAPHDTELIKANISKR
jgi:hypothetical protein